LKRRDTAFGILLAKARAERLLSATELEQLIRDSGYKIPAGYISKYELGGRNPTPEFILILVRALELGQGGEMSLLEAALADIHRKFLHRYAEALEAEARNARRGVGRKP
jgi:transcriptional regulator with XRE-family HTH domain